jgi:integrase
MGYTIQERKTTSGRTRYRVQVRNTGLESVSATFTRRRDAEHWGQRTDASVKAHRYFPERGVRKRTVGDVIRRYVADVLFDETKPQTRKTRRHFEWWERQIGELSLNDDLTEAITQGMRTLRRGGTLSGKVPSEATVRRYLMYLSAAFRHAVEMRWLRANPVSAVPNKPSMWARRDNFKLVDAERELPRFLAACLEIEPELLRFCLTLLETGARLGEAMALRWRDVDLESGQVFILTAKSGKGRTVHVRRQALEILRQRYQEIEPRLDDKVFWPELEGTRRQNYPNYVLTKAQKLSGVAVNFHGLRHAFASYLLMSGVDLKTVATLLGHTTIRCTADIYAHLTDVHLGDAVDKMSDRFLSKVRSRADTREKS